MTSDISVLRGESIRINDSISVRQPTLSDIEEVGESAYFSCINMLCSTPSDFKVQLWDSGIDWTEISDYLLFQTLYKSIDERVVELILPGVHLPQMIRVVSDKSNEVCLSSPDGAIVIDEAIYYQVVEAIRRTNSITKTTDNPGNLATKKFMLNKARRMLDRARTEKERSSSLGVIISSLVNCEHFKYNYTTVWGLTLYQLMDALQQIQRYKRCDYIMHGIYAGTIDPKALSSDDLSWIAKSNKS